MANANPTLEPFPPSHIVPIDSDDPLQQRVAKAARLNLQRRRVTKLALATPSSLDDLSHSKSAELKLIIAGGERGLTLSAEDALTSSDNELETAAEFALRMDQARSRCKFKSGVNAECWMLEGNQWRKCASMKHPRTETSSAVINGELYVFGGWYESTTRAECEVYSPTSDSWSILPALNIKRSSFVSGVVDGSVVIAGGYNKTITLNSAEVYCPETNRWNPIAPLPQAAAEATACVLNGCLFVVGGNGLRSLQMWDTTKWTLRASMPKSRKSAASVVYDGKIMVLGGTGEEYVNDKLEYQPTDSVVVYDPQTNTWAEDTPLPEPRASCKAVAQGGSIILIGGGGPPLEFKNNKWNELPDVPGGTPHACSIGLI